MLYRQILSMEIHYPMGLSDELTDLMQKMLCRDPYRRITIEEIKQHPWFPTEEYATVQQAVKMWSHDSVLSAQNDKETIALMASDGIAFPGITDDENSDLSVLYNVYNCQIRCGQVNRILRDAPSGDQVLKLRNSMPILRPARIGQGNRRECCSQVPDQKRAIPQLRRFDERCLPHVAVQRKLRRPSGGPQRDCGVLPPILQLDRIPNLADASGCMGQ
jgi:serine/threonine protein kinase